MRIFAAREIPVRLASLREALLSAGSRPAGKDPGLRHYAFTRLARLLRETSGAEIAEAAAVLPVMFMIVVGIFWFGQAFSIYGTITRAAQEGARAGTAPHCTTCGVAATPDMAAYNAVESAMVAAKLDASNARYPSPLPTLYACSTPTSAGGGAVGCDSSASSNVCVRNNVQVSSTTGAPAAATNICGISVQFQYPFQFWLPFTALNKQKIWINAAAQVRMENQ